MNPTLIALALANFAVGTGALVIAGVLNQIAEVSRSLSPKPGSLLRSMRWPMPSARRSCRLLPVLVLGLWAVAGFAFQPAQQTRLINADPASANAMLALNASALYAGQAVGAWVGGRVIDGYGPAPPGWVGAAGALATIIVFAWSLKAERSLANTSAAFSKPIA